MNTNLLFLLFSGVFYMSSSAQIPWELTNGPEGGALSPIYYNDNFTFLGDRYKFYRTSDGVNWEQLPYGNIWPMAMDNIKIAALQGYNYKTNPPSTVKFIVSYDNGLTWKEGKLPPKPGIGFSSLAVCSHGIYVPGGVEDIIYKSIDDGLTWTTIKAPDKYCYELYVFEDRLYALLSSKFYRLDLNGVDWELVSPDFGKGNYPNGIYISDQNRIYSTENTIVTSIDDGLNWKTTNISFNNLNTSFIPLGNRIYKLGSNPGLLYTEDSGLTWHEINIEPSNSLIYLSKAGGKLLGTSYNKGVLTFDESINNFISESKGLYSAAVYYLECNKDLLWAACGNGVFAYDLKTFKWLDYTKLPLSKLQYLQVTMNASGYVACCEWSDYKFYLSKDKGLTWDTIKTLDRIGQIHWLNDVLIVNGEDFTDMRSEDLGKTWMSDQYPEDIVAFKGKFIGLERGRKYLKTSTDLGKSWQILNDQGSHLYNLLGTEDRLFLITLDNQQQTSLYYSDNGENWVYANDGLPNISLDFSGLIVSSAAAWKREDKYFLYEPSIGLFVTLDSCKTWLPIEKGYYSSFVMSDTNCYSGGFGGGVLKSGIPHNYQTVSKGIVFRDDNNNGIQDNNELALAKIKVGQIETGSWYPYWSTNTNSAGQYTIGNTSGNDDTLRVELNTKYSFQSNPAYHLSNGNKFDLNFGIHFDIDVSDASISGAFAGHPRPGFDLNTYVNFQNEGNLPQDGVLSLKLDSKFHFISANPSPDVIIGKDSLVWNFKQLSLLERRQVNLLGQIEPTAQIGSLVRIRGHIKTNSIDNNSRNNNFELDDSVVGSYDPNDKEVEPANGLTADEILEGKELVYTIRFQNTGNFQADKVRITDHLDSAFNLKSLRYISSSHTVSGFKLLPGGLLEITFDSIALPDKISNEAGSQGFVKFAIQWNKAFNTQYKIKNTANIYFDYNPPIQTNVTQSGVLVSTDNENDQNKYHFTTDLILVPNPANDIVQIIPKENINGPIEISIFDLEGKECYHKRILSSSKLLSIDTHEFASGVYLISLKSDKTYFAKIVIER